MAFLSQAPRLEGLLPSHGAFQGHAAHLMRWPMRLSPNGSRGTCIPQGLSTFLHAAFTAHQWRATASAGTLCYARNSTFRRALRSAPAVDLAPRSGRSPPPLARDAGPVTGADSRAGVSTPFFFSSVMTVLVLTCKTRAVSRMPLAFIAMSTICFLTSGDCPG